ncbi:MAG: zinc ABC transporter substrate-binding protein, partial [Candidatus Thermoplasmatota archaeon]|nr:zinc ABC transporter substrate-binding protein [Candidatus Thermoplasmatota archaeon]
VGYETANWSCNWEDTADPGEDETAYYWSCDDIRDPPEDTGDNDWDYCEYYDDIATYYCTNGFGSQGTDENGEWGNSASFTHWRDGGDPRVVEDSHDEDGHDEDGDSTIEADEDEEAFDYDPHSWLDPMSFKAQAQLVLDALIEVFPNGSETFTANANAFMAELDKIHVGYVGAFGPSGTCTNKTAAANHNAYSYITERYGVEFVTVHGLDPEAEPTLADVDKVVSKINEDEINVLFIEEYTQASSVDLIVQATNVQVMYLYTMEKAPSDVNDDYLSMMNKNLDNLMTGLGCAV